MSTISSEKTKFPAFPERSLSGMSGIPLPAKSASQRLSLSPADNDEPETRDRRRLFVAIAQGVIDHLAANPDAFRLDLVKSGPAITGVKLASIDTA